MVNFDERGRSTMSEDKSPRYWHEAMGRKIWRTVPADLPPHLHRRWMAWEGARKQARNAQKVVYYLRMPDDSGRRGLLKIGHTYNMRWKLLDLESKYGGGTPEVLATEPGDGQLEQQRHEQFSHLS